MPLLPAIPGPVGQFFGGAQALSQIYRSIFSDPLTLDLDGDGLETAHADAAIVFDHEGDGLKVGTGWVSRDDAFLALDRNGNGLIDDGRELFGDSTPLTAAYVSGATDGTPSPPAPLPEGEGSGPEGEAAGVTGESAAQDAHSADGSAAGLPAMPGAAGPKAADGYAALAVFDANGDGVLDAQDPFS